MLVPIYTSASLIRLSERLKSIHELRRRLPLTMTTPWSIKLDSNQMLLVEAVLIYEVCDCGKMDITSTLPHCS